MRPSLLSEQELADRLVSLPQWTVIDGELTRSVRAADFATVIRWVDAIALAAETMDHHPDLDIRWTTLRIALTTHDKGGLTRLDCDLAEQVDEICR